MDAEAFATARAGLINLLSAGKADLSDIADNLRSDGLPQDWVDGVADLLPGQRVDLSSLIGDDAPSWALAMRGHLGAP